MHGYQAAVITDATGFDAAASAMSSAKQLLDARCADANT